MAQQPGSGADPTSATRRTLCHLARRHQALTAALAALCGASPVEASSGKAIRHRLNRGGDRQANNALWVVITLTRLRTTQHPRLRPAAHPPTTTW